MKTSKSSTKKYHLEDSTNKSNQMNGHRSKTSYVIRFCNKQLFSQP